MYVCCMQYNLVDLKFKLSWHNIVLLAKPGNLKKKAYESVGLTTI